MSIPKCKICKWYKNCNNSIWSDFLHEVSVSHKCIAQEYKYCQDVYNNKICLKIYEEKDNEN